MRSRGHAPATKPFRINELFAWHAVTGIAAALRLTHTRPHIYAISATKSRPPSRFAYRNRYSEALRDVEISFRNAKFSVGSASSALTPSGLARCRDRGLRRRWMLRP
jgi:hypothetical protein